MLPVYRRCEGPQITNLRYPFAGAAKGRRLQTCATHLPALRRAADYKPVLPVYRRCEGPQVTNLRYPSAGAAKGRRLQNLRYPSTGNIQKDDHEGRPYCCAYIYGIVYSRSVFSHQIAPNVVGAGLFDRQYALIYGKPQRVIRDIQAADGQCRACMLRRISPAALPMLGGRCVHARDARAAPGSTRSTLAPEAPVYSAH